MLKSKFRGAGTAKKCLRTFPFCSVKEGLKKMKPFEKNRTNKHGAGKINSCACKHTRRPRSLLVRLVQYDSLQWF